MNFQSYESIAEKIQHPEFSKENFLHIKFKKERLIQNLVRAKFDQEAFNEGCIDSFTTDLSEVAPDSPVQLKVGDLVTYVNEDGIASVNHKVLGFALPAYFGRVVFIDGSHSRSGKTLDSLTLQDGYIGVDETDLMTVEEHYKKTTPPFDVLILRAKKTIKNILENEGDNLQSALKSLNFLISQDMPYHLAESLVLNIFTVYEEELLEAYSTQ